MPSQNRAEIREKKIKTECVDFIYPEVRLKNKAVETKINDMIEDIVFNLIPTNIRDEAGCTASVTGRYTVSANEKSVLSLWIEVFKMPRMAANGSTILRSLTVSLENGRRWEFYELFKLNSNYRLRIKDLIEKQIAKEDLPVLGPVPPITDTQSYYLTEDTLVVYFQELVFTPHYVGPPKFFIPYSYLVNIVNPRGPMALLLEESC
ncbi:MAG: DUF3298 domain-containing protein [Thermoanaerobacteraceae bacterium]|nr:DUF3298 domain-containing protein [Thermoanaerobacteraceae bacterium]